MKAIKLKCVLMDNGEIMFSGRSLGFLSEEEIDGFVEENKY